MSQKIRGDPPAAPSSLYVSSLPFNITEGKLKTVFGQVALVKSVHVHLNQQEQPYAYINFSTPNDAANALQKLNNTKINGKEMRVMWNAPKNTRVSKHNNIYIKNLDPDINQKTLYNTFKQFGNILTCKISRNQYTNTSLGYGYVAFEHENDAKTAIEKMNGKYLSNKKITVELFKPKQQRIVPLFTNVYVKFIPFHWTEKMLINRFEQETNGKITSHTFNASKFGKSACLNFATYDQAKMAISKLNGRSFQDNYNGKLTKLFVTKSEKRIQRDFKLKQNQINYNYLDYSNDIYQDGTNLKITDLPPNIDNRQLFKAFAGFGQIISLNIMREIDGKSKGFGFVQFALKHSAMKALMTKVYIAGYLVSISIAKCRSRPTGNTYMSHRNHRSFRSYSHRDYNVPNYDDYGDYGDYYDYNDYNDTPICKYFNHKYGCSRGSSCRFRHVSNRYNPIKQSISIDYNDDIVNNDFKQNHLSSSNAVSFPQTKQFVRKKLTKKIKPFYPIFAKRIINHLLNDDVDELSLLLHDEDKLYSKCKRIKKMLKQNDNLANDNDDNDDNNDDDDGKDNDVKDQDNDDNDDNDNGNDNEGQQDEHKDDINLNAIHKKNIKLNDDLFINNEVKNWLTNVVHLQIYFNNFIKHGYDDLETIQLMNEQDLIQMEIIKTGHRKKLLVYIEKLNTN